MQLSQINSVRTTSGLRVLIIGGDRREQAIQKLLRSLKFRSINWLSTRERNTIIFPFEKEIKCSRYDVVIALYGLIRHQHSDYIRSLCKRERIPLLVMHRSLSSTQVLRSLVSLHISPQMRSQIVINNQQ